MLGEDLDAAIDSDRLVADICRIVEIPSITGAEHEAQQAFAELADRLALDVELHDEPLAALRDAADYPGEEVDRDRLVTVVARLSGASAAAPRLVLSGHIDVVPPGEQTWSTPPFAADIRDGWIRGRGTADMKAGLVAGLHAMAAAAAVLGQPPGDVVLHSVAAEEDGGLGALAALRRDDAFAGCVIAEPTDGTVVCAQAGALTWRARVSGRSTHASTRLDGVSALDRFVPIYAALQDLEAALNRNVTHPLMSELRLPYPLNVGRIRAGDWASSVPDELVVDGRVGVPIGMSPADVRQLLESAVLAAADDRGPSPEVSWTGGQFAPAETDPDARVVALVLDAATAVGGARPRLAGVPYGTDLRHYTARGIPTVLWGPGNLAQAHATDEGVEIDAVVRHARGLARVAALFGGH